jgi:hypothetical protein
MARPAARSGGFSSRVLLVIVLGVIAWLVLRIALGFVFSLIRGLLFLALFAVIAWVVLIGPPERRD